STASGTSAASANGSTSTWTIRCAAARPRPRRSSPRGGGRRPRIDRRGPGRSAKPCCYNDWHERTDRGRDQRGAACRRHVGGDGGGGGHLRSGAGARRGGDGRGAGGAGGGGARQPRRALRDPLRRRR